MFPRVVYEKTINNKSTNLDIAFNELYLPSPVVISQKTYLGQYCSCVAYLEAKFPQIKGIGLARYWPVNAKFGVVGGVIVQNLSYAGHVSFIVGFDDIGYVVEEANYSRCKLTSRTIPYGDKSIIGFWSNN